MQITRDSNYLASLDNVMEYIAKDSFNKALTFLDKLDYVINNITNFPYKNRQSLYYNDKDIRDLIFKGYTISYLIDNENNKIVILDIFKWINK
jgi:hypothetical protein